MKLLTILCFLALYTHGHSQSIYFVDQKREADIVIYYVNHSWEADEIVTKCNYKFQSKLGYWYVSPISYQKYIIKIYVTPHKWEADWKIYIVNFNEKYKVKISEKYKSRINLILNKRL